MQLHGSNSMRLADCLNSFDVLRQVIHVKLHHVKDGDTNLFSPGSLKADGLLTCTGDMFQQIRDVTAIGAV